MAAALLVLPIPISPAPRRKRFSKATSLDETNSRFDGLPGLRSGHGGAAREIVRSTADFAVTQSRYVGKFVIHTDVDHFDFDAVMSGLER